MRNLKDVELLNMLQDNGAANNGIEISCFLCEPEMNLVVSQNTHYFTMLGLGPIVEGYALIASVKHTRSLLDIPRDQAEKYQEYKEYTRSLLEPIFGNCIITEHGRVPPCVSPIKDVHDAHCFHAHSLLFPVTPSFDHPFDDRGLDIHEYSNYLQAHSEFMSSNEYLYYERADGSCVIASPKIRMQRQYFRYKIADSIGHPKLADWREYPRIPVVVSALLKLQKNGHEYALDKKEN